MLRKFLFICAIAFCSNAIVNAENQTVTLEKTIVPGALACDFQENACTKNDQPVEEQMELKAANSSELAKCGACNRKKKNRRNRKDEGVVILACKDCK